MQAGQVNERGLVVWSAERVDNRLGEGAAAQGWKVAEPRAGQ